MTPSSGIEAALALADAHFEESLARLFELIRIPSISTDPAYAGECRRAADWLAGRLSEIGFEAGVRPTAGHPMVVGHAGKELRPHVLFYGHYDVQPVDPLALWTSPPFEPELVPQPGGDAHITGRGASDDKGQLLTFVEACRFWKAATGSLPLRLSVLFEGEEESGSPSLPDFLETASAELRADIVLVCDTDMWDASTPAITTMMRGIVKEEFEIVCANRDLHSGIYGNAARNPLQLVADIIAGLRNAEGGVTLPGFYDGVHELPQAISALWQKLPLDEAALLSDVGLRIPAGESGRSILEQVWARPSFEVNGITGGYSGEGFKTVIPSRASAKVSFRLVEGQDPAAIREAFRRHVASHVPADCKVTFRAHGAGAATVMPVDGVFLQRALRALRDEWDGRAAIAGSGGSIPIVTEFKEKLGMDALLVGFARFDNRIHSPNEKYDLSSYRKGIRSWIRILDAFSE